MTSTREDRIDLYILTGFLGSGKTTLLNALLRDPQLADTAVIVNEFGEVGLDHLLVEAASGDVILLDSGCLCCAIGESFADTLVDLWVRRQRGDVPAFRRVVVETSGLAEPLPLVATVMKNSLVSPRYRMAGVITVVDAVFGLRSLAEHREAREQLALADTVVLTKGELADARCDEVRAAIAAHAPTARIIAPPRGAADARLMLDSLGWSASDLPGIDHNHHHDHVHAGHASATLQRSLILDEPVSWPALAAFIEMVKRADEPLLRCKGLFAVRGERGPVLVQGVRNIVETIRLAQWPTEERHSRLVCIFASPPRDFENLIAPLRSPA